VIAWDAVARRAETVTRRGCPRVVWDWAIRNRMPEAEADYCGRVTGPLSKEFIDDHCDSRDIYDN
jgi:hypothetical protein